MPFAVYRVSDGELYSLGTVAADEADLKSRGLAVKVIPQLPDLTTVMWDPALLDFVPRPPEPTALDRFLNDPAIKVLPDMLKTTIAQKIREYFPEGV